jgi:alkylated DNA repair dioxygenase AlkB
LEIWENREVKKFEVLEMDLVKMVGKVQGQNLYDLHDWCQNHRYLLKPTVSQYATGRQELWIRRTCDLRKQATITEGFRDDRLEALGDRVLPNFDIGILLLYQPGVKINLHRDHTVFASTAVSINLGEATFLMAEMGKKGTELKPQDYPLTDGDVLKFNCKILHGIEAVNKERWCIVFWYLK